MASLVVLLLALAALHLAACSDPAAAVQRSSSSSTCNSQDFQALQGLKSGFAQSSVLLPESWSNSTSCCQWSWITCNSMGRVDSLNLSSLALSTDSEPDQTFVQDFIILLPYLRSLDLSNLNLSTSVLVALSSLRSLETLAISNSSLSGQFPVAVANLTGLRRLDISNNLFDTSDSEISSAICSLGHLEELDMSALPGLITTVPTCIGERLRNLTSLDLSANALAQEFPASFSGLTKLVSLDLSDNYFTGSLSALCSLTELRSINLDLAFDASNSSGSSTSLPACIGNLSQLTELRLSGCYLVGAIPDSIGQLSKLRYLALDGNSFSTTIPSSLGNLTGLEILLLNKDATGGSDFFGEIPASLGNLRRLQDFELSSAPGVVGQIPDSFQNLASLQTLALNNLGIGGELTGSLFRRMTKLQYLDLSQNYFTGVIPDSIGSLVSVQEIYLYNNSFTGSIPESVSRLTQLTNLDLSSNELSGVIPGLETLTQLQVLDLSANELSGRIPETLGNLVELATLDLSYNELNGSIPSSLHNLISLDYFSVSNNQLSGPIPSELSNFDASSFEGNAGLCGFPLDPCSAE